MSKIFLAWSSLSTDNIIMVAREMDDLVGEVYREFFTAAHPQRNSTITPLNPVMHRVEWWTTPDGTTLATRLLYVDIDASMTTDTTSFEIVTFIVDRGFTDPDDPADGDDEYINTDLAGKELVPFKPGFGALVKGTHFDLLPGGGFVLTDGSLFNSQEEWTVLVQNVITTVEAPGGASGFPNGIVDITANTNYVQATHKNKLLNIVGSGAVITLTITDMSLITNNSVFGITTHSGTQRYCALQLPASKFVNVYGTLRNIIWLARGETVQLIKSGDYLYVVQWTGDVHRLGDIIKKDGEPPVNGLPETGGWYLKTDYPRFYNWYVNDLPVGDLGSGTQDVTPTDENKSKFIIGTTKFWVPDAQDFFDRNSDGIRTSGVRQAETIGPHFHNSGTDAADIPDPNNIYNRSPIDHIARAWHTGTTDSASGQRASTDINRNVAGMAFETENRPKNRTVYSYRII